MAISFIVTGRNGQLGRCLVRRLEADPNCELRRATAHDDLDIADRDAVMRVFESLPEGPPSWLINAAAYNAVDLCESEIEASMAVNGEAPGHLAEVCREAGVGLIHVSTDYVFDGRSKTPYRESDQPRPVTAYGRSKLEGERRVLAARLPAWVVRTSWVFGPGKNFVGAILRQAYLRELGKGEGPLRVVDDQLGCPTYSADLADALISLASSGAPEAGLLHYSNSEPCTWWEFAREILDRSGFAGIEIDRGRTSDLDLAAERPAYSVLDCSRAAALGLEMRSWRAALEAYLDSADGADVRADARALAEAA